MYIRFTALILAAALFAVSCTGSADTRLGDPASAPGPDTNEAAVDATPTPTPGEAPSPDDTDDSPAPAASSASTAIDLLDEVGFNGLVAVAQRGDVDVVPFGVADPTTQAAIDERTVFDIGSITKQFTGAAITALHADGQLSVDDHVGDYLPGIGTDKASISLHQLLTHTAGLPAALGFDYDEITRDDYISLVAGTPLLSTPGVSYAYSNVGYSLLAAVIETVTGETYETYLRERLFEPAGLIDTGYVQSDFSDNEIATGFIDNEVFGRPNEQVWNDDGPYWHLRGNGGLLSTAEDMLRWVDALTGTAVLDDEAKELLFGAHVTEGGGSAYGYGWSVTDLDGNRLLTHNGGNGVFFADLLHFPDDQLTIFLATNSASPRLEDAAWSVASDVLGTEGPQMRPVDCPVIGPDEAGVMSVIDEVSATPAGATFAELVAVATAAPGSIDDAALTEVGSRLLRPELAPDATDEAIRLQIESLQVEFDGYGVTRLVAHESGRTFAIVLEGGGELLVFSATMSDTEPAHPRCVDVTA